MPLTPIATTLLLVASALALSAQASAPNTGLDRWLGRWEGPGTILGQASRAELEWAPALEGRFLRLTFTSHIGPPPKTQRFEGHAYYQAGTGGAWRATWFDSSGSVRPITAHLEGDALRATWGTPDTEVGETTYRIVAPDRMEVVDRVRGKSGEWREFGRTLLTRASVDAGRARP